MSDRSWVVEATEYLEKIYQGLGPEATAASPTVPKFKPALRSWESEFFLLGLEHELFRIDPKGYVQTPLLRESPSGTQQQMIQLFWSQDKGRRRFLFREGFCQLATASRLVITYGWDVLQIEMEPRIKGLAHLAYGVDILIRSEAGEPLICCEVKRSLTEHRKLIAAFEQCCERGPHPKSDCTNRQNHPKFAFCSALRPPYFLVVSPDKEQCFELSYSEDRIALLEVDDTPRKGA